jgi:hypothetical protein
VCTCGRGRAGGVNMKTRLCAARTKGRASFQPQAPTTMRSPLLPTPPPTPHLHVPRRSRRWPSRSHPPTFIPPHPPHPHLHVYAVVNDGGDGHAADGGDANLWGKREFGGSRGKVAEVGLTSSQRGAALCAGSRLTQAPQCQPW